MEGSRKCPLCRASFGENEVEPKQQHIQQNHHHNYNQRHHNYNQRMSVEDTFVVACMVALFRFMPRFLTALMVILVNLAWILPMIAAGDGGWIWLALISVPGNRFYYAYWVKDEQDICCSVCEKGPLLFFSFLFSALPCAFYAYIMYLRSNRFRWSD